MNYKKTAIIGIGGIPANYGGFETVVDNLVKYHAAKLLPNPLTVFCSSKSYPVKIQTYLSAQLKYLSLKANGPQSILYDIWSLFSAVRNHFDVILVFGVSGAIALPLVRLFSSARIVTNIDGIEWRREKWRGFARHFLHFSEMMAVRYSHEIIADNSCIEDYVSKKYGINCHMIAYGGDHAIAVDEVVVNDFDLPQSFSISICRIEPENNVHMLLEAFAKLKTYDLVMLGNWNNSVYGRELHTQYAVYNNIYLLDPIYDLGKLKYLRSQASYYIHGHSAGGTNPSLVEAMHFGKAVLAFDCNYNRCSTENKALFFSNSEELRHLIETMKVEEANRVGRDMFEIANRRYTWRIIAKQYFALISA